MPLRNLAVNTLFTSRLKEIEYFKEHPFEVQDKMLKMLTKSGSESSYGKEYGMHQGMSSAEFATQLPIVDYDFIRPYIDRVRSSEQKVLWDTPVRWFAKSSGTTGSKSKYIPVTREGLNNSHMRGPMDILIQYINNYPDSKILHGKMLTLGGSKRLELEGDNIFSGDLSSILIDNTPSWAYLFRQPNRKTALLADFDEKVQRICEETTDKKITAFTGVPSWNLVMLNRILEYTGKSNLLEVWENLELFVHGGMNFAPYREQYNKIIPSSEMRYLDTYNASEGFFGIADRVNSNELVLMLDYGTYYEFIPTDTLSDHTTAVPLEGVKLGVNYAMVISSSNGLWRYQIGDTVEFTSTSPHRIRITGRTKMYINAFGEEVIIDNAERAMEAACRATNASVGEYTVAPIYMHDNENGTHEWIVEFNTAPDNLELFTDTLDDTLRSVNSDYDAKRTNNTTLLRPKVRVVAQGTFLEWMKSEGKLGGQSKVPRLNNDRRYADSIINYVNNK